MDIINNIKNIFSRSKPESLPGPLDDFWYTSNPYAYYDDTDVDETTALKCSAVWACVRIISENIASLPLHLYKDTKNGKELAVNHRLYGLFKNPNPELTQFKFIETLMSHLLRWGNSYNRIWRNRLGEIQLYNLGPDRVTVERKQGQLVYTYHQKDGTDKVFIYNEMLHIPGLGYDGIIGYSPIEMAQKTIGLSLTSQDYAKNFFDNGAVPLLFLKHPSVLSDKARENLKKGFDKAFGRKGKRFGTAMLEEGADVEALTINARDSQLLELRQFQLAEIARVYNVPCHMIQDLSKSSFNNIQELSISFVKYTLNPWLNRLEQAFNKALLSPKEQNVYYFKFKVDGLLRGDTKTRYETYTKAINNGIMSINEVRAKEELNPIENGDIHLVPLNMIDIKDSNINTIEDNKRSIEHLKPLIKDGFVRCLSKESLFLQRTIKKCLDKKDIDFNDKCDEFYNKFTNDLSNNLRPVFVSCRSINGNMVNLDDVVKEYIKESRNSINNLFEKYNEENIVQAVEDETENWQKVRIEELTDNLIEKLDK